MDIHLPEHIVAALETVVPSDRPGRLRVRTGKVTVEVIEMDARGFTVAAAAPRLRGAAAILNGSRHAADCLIVAAERQGAVTRYEYKRRTDISERPPLDYARDDDAPIALLS